MSKILFETRVLLAGVVAVVVLVCAGAAGGQYSDGFGTEAEPYEIGTVADWQELMDSTPDWDKHFVLIADLDMNGVTVSPVGNDANNFTGIFDGNDHVIRNVDINTPSSDHVGVFGYLGQNGQIKNLGLEDISIFGRCYVGGLVGYNEFGIVSNCYVRASVSGGDDTGGLVGHSEGGIISDCHVISNVSGGSDAGGLIGTSSGSTISNCRAKADVSGYSLVGGLIGSEYGGTVSGCFAVGDITANMDQVGGLLGQCDGCSVLNCYAVGDISGDWGVGGLIGAVPYDANVSNCYAVCVVDGNNVSGGVLGYNDEGKYTKCFWDSDIAQDVNGIGNATDPNVIGESTTNMQRQSTFASAGWDFVDVWDIGQNQTYPFLRIYAAGDINHDGVVDFRDLALLAQRWLSGVE